MAAVAKSLEKFIGLMDKVGQTIDSATPLTKNQFWVMGSYVNHDQERISYIVKATTQAEDKLAPTGFMNGRQRLLWAEAVNGLLSELCLEKVFTQGDIYLRPFPDTIKSPYYVCWGRVVSSPYNVAHIDTTQLWFDVNSFIRID